MINYTITDMLWGFPQTLLIDEQRNWNIYWVSRDRLAISLLIKCIPIYWITQSSYNILI